MDEHLLARLSSIESSMGQGFDRVERRLASIERQQNIDRRQQADDRVEAAKTSAKVAGMIGIAALLLSVGGAAAVAG